MKHSFGYTFMPYRIPSKEGYLFICDTNHEFLQNNMFSLFLQIKWTNFRIYSQNTAVSFSRTSILLQTNAMNDYLIHFISVATLSKFLTFFLFRIGIRKMVSPSEEWGYRGAFKLNAQIARFLGLFPVVFSPEPRISKWLKYYGIFILLPMLGKSFLNNLQYNQFHSK